MSREPILRVRDLRTYFMLHDATVRAVDGVSFDLFPNETLAIVGESGCGKSVTASSIMRLVPDPPGRTVGGEVLFEGRDLLRLSEREMCTVRGDRISMIFQEPMTSLNPVLTIGDQLIEPLAVHRSMSPPASRRRAIELLDLVRLPDAASQMMAYPHQLSGGMRQRVMIAMALACEPKVLIADEPTTALDVTIQAQILVLLQSLQRQLGMAIVLITHDLGVVAEVADRVIVMYAGRKVEEGGVEKVLDDPKHPYTVGLLGSMSSMGGGSGRRRLREIPGMVPSVRESLGGCLFAPRCEMAQPICLERAPDLAGGQRSIACHVVSIGGQ